MTAIILAGGKSTRMKCDKAFLKLGTKTVIELLISKLEKKFSKLLIIANDVGKYATFGIEVVSDIFPDKGPLGGIYTGLVSSGSFYNFIFGCDMPFINMEFIEYMIRSKGGADIVVPRWDGRFQPLHAIYSKRCAGLIKEHLNKDDPKITNLFSQVNVKIIEQGEVEGFVLGQALFANINTKEDYEAARKMLWV